MTGAWQVCDTAQVHCWVDSLGLRLHSCLGDGLHCGLGLQSCLGDGLHAGLGLHLSLFQSCLGDGLQAGLGLHLSLFQSCLATASTCPCSSLARRSHLHRDRAKENPPDLLQTCTSAAARKTYKGWMRVLVMCRSNVHYSIHQISRER